MNHGNLTTSTRRKTGSDTITEGIRIQADAQYMPADSDPAGGQYLYAYRVVITNVGTQPARLKSRHWVIIDAVHKREDVTGDGVVGKSPRLAPGESFAYTSGCPLSTTWGTMEGTYVMERDDARTFRARIGRFFLVPNAPRLSAIKNP
jgi:ApaG protein